jgi:hypothetical protein
MARSLASATVSQACFASGQSVENEGYQIIARSRGIDDHLARELTAWAPSHDSLQPGLAEAESVNGHKLADGRWCLSTTRFANEEYSGRGRNVVTWLLVADSEAITLLGSHPLRILDAALVAGWNPASEPAEEVLPQIELTGRSRVVNLEAVAHACAQFGAATIAGMVDALMDSAPCAIVLEGRRRLLLDAVLSLLPLAERATVTFTTGLSCSLRRPFRLHFLSPHDDAVRAYRRTFAGRVTDLRHASLAQPAPARGDSQLGELLAAKRWCDVRRYVLQAIPGSIGEPCGLSAG